MDQPRRHKLLFGTLIGFYAICNAAVYPVIEYWTQNNFQYDSWINLAIMFSIGAIMSEAGSLAIWAVLGGGNHWLRNASSFAVGLFLFAWWLLGVVSTLVYTEAADLDGFLQVVVVMLLCLPAFYLSVQTPLWPVRLWFRWRIESSRDGTTLPTRSLSIMDMMVSMMVVAVALSLVRLGYAWMQFNEEFVPSSLEFWLFIMMMLATTTGFSLASTLPMVPIVLRLQNTRRAYLGAVVYCMLAIGITTGITAITQLASASTIFFWQLMRSASMLFGLAVGLTIPLFFARHAGFRLRWGK